MRIEPQVLVLVHARNCRFDGFKWYMLVCARCLNSASKKSMSSSIPIMKSL